MIKEAKIYNREKIASSIHGAGKTGYLHVEEWNYNTPYHHTQKYTQNGLKT